MGALDKLKENTVDLWVDYNVQVSSGESDASNSAVMNNIACITATEGLSGAKQIYDCLNGPTESFVEEVENADESSCCGGNRGLSIVGDVEGFFCDLNTTTPDQATWLNESAELGSYSCINHYLMRFLKNLFELMALCSEDPDDCFSPTYNKNKNALYKSILALLAKSSSGVSKADEVEFLYSKGTAFDATNTETVLDNAKSKEGYSVDAALEYILAKINYLDWKISLAIEGADNAEAFSATPVEVIATVTQAGSNSITLYAASSNTIKIGNTSPTHIRVNSDQNWMEWSTFFDINLPGENGYVLTEKTQFKIDSSFTYKPLSWGISGGTTSQKWDAYLTYKDANNSDAKATASATITKDSLLGYYRVFDSLTSAQEVYAAVPSTLTAIISSPGSWITYKYKSLHNFSAEYSPTYIIAIVPRRNPDDAKNWLRLSQMYDPIVLQSAIVSSDGSTISGLYSVVIYQISDPSTCVFENPNFVS